MRLGSGPIWGVLKVRFWTVFLTFLTDKVVNISKVRFWNNLDFLVQTWSRI